MDFENILSESMEQAREVPAESLERPAEFPPKLEHGAADDSGDIQAPKLERGAGSGHDLSFGESFDSRIARHKVEKAIENGNKIATQHRVSEWQEVLTKETEEKEAKKDKD